MLRFVTFAAIFLLEMEKIRKQEALDYHKSGRKGKIEVIPTKPTSTQKDLSLSQCQNMSLFTGCNALKVREFGLQL